MASKTDIVAWLDHDDVMNMRRLSTLLAGDRHVDFPHKESAMKSFYVFFVVNLNRLLNKQSIYRWLETPWSCQVMSLLIVNASYLNQRRRGRGHYTFISSFKNKRCLMFIRHIDAETSGTRVRFVISYHLHFGIRTKWLSFYRYQSELSRQRAVESYCLFNAAASYYVRYSYTL